MTGRERIDNILRLRPVDRIGLYEHFWGDTLERWQAEGHIAKDEDLASHFGFDLRESWSFNMIARHDFEPETIEETVETFLQRDGNGALLRRHKLHDGTPEHVDFAVKDRSTWEELIKPYMTPDPVRIDFDGYRTVQAEAAADNQFFVWSGINVFELMHPVCGHEYMLMGMALDPDWIAAMAMQYAETTVELQRQLFAECGKPDGIWYYEDMGFKGRPFMSLQMYRDLIEPAHRHTIDFAHQQDLPVIMHSCGFVEPLLPGVTDAGIDCLQVIEVKAGMDPLRIRNDYDRLVLCGGMDARNLVANDIPAIRAELEAKVPVLKENAGYILHSDHSIPTDTDYETYRTFVDIGLELGTYR
ncbi:MAG: uroporphyrinogen decarboxylase family protein [Lentisphaeria bacterium]|jgi:uroporphyrinogen decarboxylase|nr:uroporphyrinogen decarboxylase family protein [Lentisphaeria bacterium]